MYTKPEEIRQKLSTDDARARFDEINTLGCRWMSTAMPDGSVHVSPSIYLRVIPQPGLSHLHNYPAKNYDQAITNVFAKIVRLSTELQATLIVHPTGPDRKAFFYNKDTCHLQISGGR